METITYRIFAKTSRRKTDLDKNSLNEKTARAKKERGKNIIPSCSACECSLSFRTAQRDEEKRWTRKGKVCLDSYICSSRIQKRENNSACYNIITVHTVRLYVDCECLLLWKMNFSLLTSWLVFWVRSLRKAAPSDSLRECYVSIRM